MKKTIAVLGGLLVSLVASRADIILNEGQSYTHEFHIPELEQVPGPIWYSISFFSFTVDPSTFDAGDEVLVEGFANSTNDVPFYSKLNDPSGFHGGAASQWADRQGVVRITVTKGSVVLRSVMYGLFQRENYGYSRYQHTQPVPVPPPQPPPPVEVKEGESFTHEFQIPMLLPAEGPFWVPNTHFAFSEVPGTYDPVVDEVVIEAFENSTNEVPYYSSAGLRADTIPSPTGRWSDLQGVVRLRVIKGSVALESLSYGLITRGPSLGFSSYNNTLVLPLPEVRVRRGAAGQIGVRWPAGFIDWVLESAPEPSRSVSWTKVPASRVRLEDDWSMLIPSVGSNQFFRLRRIVEPTVEPH